MKIKHFRFAENSITQSLGLSSLSPSPPWCCRHSTSRCWRVWVMAYQGTPPSPWPTQLVISMINVNMMQIFTESYFSSHNNILLPMMSAVSFLSTKICTLILAILSAMSGKRKARSLSMFLWKHNWMKKTAQAVCNLLQMNFRTSDAHQTSSLLWSRLLCW